MGSIAPDDVKLFVWVINSASPNDPNQAAINLTQPIGGNPGTADLVAPEIHAQANATVRGSPGEDVGFWRFGFIQLKLITDDWAHYRGATPADGSVFLAMDRKPARTQQLCRDTYIVGLEGFPIVGPVIFYDPDKPLVSPFGGQSAGYLPGNSRIPNSGLLPIVIDFFDSPDRHFDLVQNNAAFNPARQNFLYSLQTGAAFATMFAVQKGLGEPIRVLKHFLWNVRWRAHFQPNAAGQIAQLPVKGPNEMRLSISRVHSGNPDDPRFRYSITDRSLPVCNVLMRAAFGNPVRLQSRKWEDYKVRH